MNVKIRHLNIEVTKRCNQRCFYCFNNSGLGSVTNELALGRWMAILYALQGRGLESVHLTGGEPFAYHHAVELLAGAQKMNLSTSILSNGFRVRELTEAFPDVFRGLTVAQISLDSMNKETHNLRRGHPRAWQDALAAIRVLRSICVPVEVSCVVSETNLADVRKVADFCQTVDAGLIIRPIIAAGRASTHKTSNSFANDLSDCMQSLRARRNLHVVSDRFCYVTDELEAQPTHWPNDIQTVHHNGKLRFRGAQEIDLTALAA